MSIANILDVNSLFKHQEIQAERQTMELARATRGGSRGDRNFIERHSGCGRIGERLRNRRDVLNTLVSEYSFKVKLLCLFISLLKGSSRFNFT